MIPRCSLTPAGRCRISPMDQTRRFRYCFRVDVGCWLLLLLFSLSSNDLCVCVCVCVCVCLGRDRCACVPASCRASASSGESTRRTGKRIPVQFVHVVFVIVRQAVTVQTPALRCIGNIVTGDDAQTQHVRIDRRRALFELFVSTCETFLFYVIYIYIFLKKGD
jgi:hypothetical protein